MFWENVLRFQAEKIDPWIGLRNAAGVALPLAASLWMNALPSGLVVAIGALNVAFSDSEVPYVQRARRMLTASAVVGCGVFVGSLCAWNHALTLLVTAVWAFAAGMLVALDTTAADLGAISLITLLVFAAFPLRPDQALLSGLLALCGGCLQTVLSVALWPLRRYEPQRRALGELFRELAVAASGRTRATEAPPASTQSTAAQDSLAALDRDRSLEAERYRALLSQGERIRLELLVLARLRIRIEREDPTAKPLQTLDRFFEIAAELMRILADELLAGAPPGRTDERFEETRMLAEVLRANPADIVHDVRRHIDALAGQLRAALDLAGHAMPEGAALFDRREAAQPWRLRLQGTVATLRANLSLQSAACRHAIRLSVCVAIGEALGQTLGLSRAYWLPMTVVIVLKPDFSATFSRGVLRLAGTFAGLLLATALFHVLPARIGREIALIGIFTFMARCFGPANYAIATTAITALVVVLASLNGISPNSVILARAINTAIGGAVALAAYGVWPTWERSHLAETMAQLLDAYASYFHAVRSAYEHPDARADLDLDRRRLAGRRARSNLQASLDRLGAEPGTSPERIRILGGIFANSHRLAHAFMALEAGTNATRRAPPSPAFRTFAEHVELTMASLAAALRGSPLDRSALPDLREDHRALLFNGQYALANVEADRIVNALNTLTEDVSRWTSHT